MVKNPPANAGDLRDSGSIPESGRSLGGGHGNPLQYSCLGNSMDRGAWQARVCRVAERDMTEVTLHRDYCSSLLSGVSLLCSGVSLNFRLSIKLSEK